MARAEGSSSAQRDGARASCIVFEQRRVLHQLGVLPAQRGSEEEQEPHEQQTDDGTSAGASSASSSKSARVGRDHRFGENFGLFIRAGDVGQTLAYTALVQSKLTF